MLKVDLIFKKCVIIIWKKCSFYISIESSFKEKEVERDGVKHRKSRFVGFIFLPLNNFLPIILFWKVRKVGETVYGTVTSLATAFEFPISVLKVRNVLCFAKSVRGKDNYDVFSQDSARPEYWVPDAEITSCSVCDRFYSLISPFSSVFLHPSWIFLPRPIGSTTPAGQQAQRVHHCRQVLSDKFLSLHFQNYFPDLFLTQCGRGVCASCSATRSVWFQSVQKAQDLPSDLGHRSLVLHFWLSGDQYHHVDGTQQSGFPPCSHAIFQPIQYITYVISHIIKHTYV